MILAIDIGNTHTVLGLVEGREVLHHWRFSTEARRTEDEIAIQLDGILSLSGVQRRSIRGACVSSVVPPLGEVWSQTVGDALGLSPLVVSSDIPLPIELAVDNPAEVGTDRIANSVAGRERFGAPVLVVDFGTATTVDVVDQAGRYRGGVILPGPEVAAEALFQKTAALPRIALRRPERVIGSNTVACMHSGLFHGFLGAVDRLIDAVRAELGAPKCTAVATGGLGAVIVEETDRLSAHLPWLTLEGLVAIWEHASKSR
jgi:type III pantothenate kinase